LARPPRVRSSTGAIDKFLTRSKSLSQRAASGARLIFSIDATASREHTWEQASRLQGEMFLTTQKLGGLSVQLCYYRGLNELRATRWLLDEHALLQEMQAVRCEGGYTQIARLLEHAAAEHRRQAVKALVFIGDACEENPDLLIGKAGELGILGLPLFMFQEGRDPQIESTFRQMARVSGGAWAHFDQNSARELAELLGAVARYAAAGKSGLLEDGTATGAGVKLLLDQLK